MTVSPGTYSFFGVISGLTINAKITNTGGKSYTFDATANANLSKTKSPATVTLTIGNDLVIGQPGGTGPHCPRRRRR